ncbi:MAG TPA: DUF6084 family protein [Candidatus Deferrimicrobiaceae bacterium]|nr:DUF6084 family protein [Candidatus Deferrimicrobiaceae bacterium]
MPELSFQIEKAEPQRFTVAPTLLFKLRITNAAANETVHSVALRCQIQLEVTRRQYTPEDQSHLKDLFGDSDRWSQTLKTMLWTHASVVAPAFQDTAVVDLPVPCTFDFNVAATKYFHGLAEGDVPLNFLFSGTVFYADESGSLQVAPIPWDKEARFRLPVKSWREMMEIYYPNTAWLCLRRDVFERIYQYKVERGIPTWEQALERLLPASEEAVKR